jgi:hypothetical protein
MSDSLDDQTAHAKVCSSHRYAQQKLMEKKMTLGEVCYHPINYGNQLMTWILLILSVSSVLIGNSFFIFTRNKKKKK